MKNSSETNASQGQHEARRRNLLRLGAAAPMVLTLRPGASFAASMLCTERGLDAADAARADAAEKLATSPDADEWVRAQVDILELHKIDFNGNGPQDTLIEGKYVLGTDRTTFWRVDGGVGGGPMIASAKSTPRVSFGDGGAIGKDASFSGDWNTSNAQGSPIEKRWALIKVDPKTGEPLGYSWEPEAIGGVATSVGCFHSLHPGVARYTGGWDGIGAYIKRVLGLG
ncbi:MAG: hypothetical protein LT102_08490 [Burkholderiaceae bacterium]|nr:hypothetical protein [Burkholderiaceae bacterium]